MLLAVCALLLSAQPSPLAARAAASDRDATEQLGAAVDDLLQNIDFSALESAAATDGGGLFGGFFGTVSEILDKGYADGSDLFRALGQVFFSAFTDVLPMLAVVVALAVLANILNTAGSKSVTGVVYYACFCGVLIAVSVRIVAALASARSAVVSMQTQMNAVFPILLTLLTALGAGASAAVFQPAVAMLTQGVASVVTYCVLPLFGASYVLQIVSALNPSVRLERLSGVFRDCSKWLIGIVFTVFSAFLAVQGVTAGTHDGVSFRTARFAISHYVPIVGGYLSEGLNLVLAGSVLVKNAIGLSAALLLGATLLKPVLSLVGLKLVLLLCGAVTEPLGTEGYGKFCTGLARSLDLLIAAVVGMAFLYFVTLMLLIGSANYVVAA